MRASFSKIMFILEFKVERFLCFAPINLVVLSVGVLNWLKHRCRVLPCLSTNIGNLSGEFSAYFKARLIAPNKRYLYKLSTFRPPDGLRPLNFCLTWHLRGKELLCFINKTLFSWLVTTPANQSMGHALLSL